MDRINIVKMICGTLMAAGIYIPAGALAGLLFKVIVIGADTLDAAIRRRDRKDPRLLLYSEISGGIYGLHGTALPLAAASMICAVYVRMEPGIESTVPVFMILLWEIAAACYSNIRYCISFSAHSALFIRKFNASYVSLQNGKKAFDEACASIPDGAVRSRCISAGKQLAKGMRWNNAVNGLDNGLCSGKGLAICLKMFGGSQTDPDESVIDYFAELLSDSSSLSRKRTALLRKSGIMLLAAMLIYSAVNLYCVISGLTAVSAAVLLSAGIVLAVMAAAYRNMCIDGRVI